MTQEYTPTTENVKKAYWGLHEKNYYDFTAMQREENFDRWLSAHDAELQADAWDEGFTNGRDLAASGQPMTRNNPYRERKQPHNPPTERNQQ